jgi:hypothetical protein
LLHRARIGDAAALRQEAGSANYQNIAGHLLDQSAQLADAGLVRHCFEHQEAAIELDDPSAQRRRFGRRRLGLKDQ